MLLLLREDRRAVADELETAPSALAPRRRVAHAPQRGRETRGPSVVTASDGAVENLDGHRGRVADGRRPAQTEGAPRTTGRSVSVARVSTYSRIVARLRAVGRARS